MTTKTIVSISANTMSAGKSTLRSILEDEAKRNKVKAAQLRFADPMKKAIAALLSSASGEPEGVVLDKLYNDAAYKAAPAQPESVFNGRTVREIMQLFGTEFGRQMINSNLWTEIMKERVRNELESGTGLVIVDDVRFLNEYEMLFKFIEEGYGFIDIYISRGEGSQSRHASEGAMDFLKDRAAITIANNAGLAEYKHKCSEISREILQSIAERQYIPVQDIER